MSDDGARESRRERDEMAREMARLWKLAKSAIRLVDEAKLRDRCIYEIDTTTMLALRHRCAEVRLPIKMAERDRARAERENQTEDSDE